jgi:hypothetical protein
LASPAQLREMQTPVRTTNKAATLKRIGIPSLRHRPFIDAARLITAFVGFVFWFMLRSFQGQSLSFFTLAATRRRKALWGAASKSITMAVKSIALAIPVAAHHDSGCDRMHERWFEGERLENNQKKVKWLQDSVRMEVGRKALWEMAGNIGT